MIGIQAVDPLDPDGQQLFEEWVGVHAAADDAIWSGHGSSWSADELRELQRATAGRRTALAAVDQLGAVVGAVQLLEPLRDNLDRAYMWLAVRPDRWRQGIGSTLLRAGEDLAAGAGRTIMTNTSDSPQESGGPGGAFARHHGYELAQVDLRQDLTLSSDRQQVTSHAPTDPEAAEPGPTGQGPTGQGATEQGATEQGATEQGPTENGGTEQVGATDPEATGPGAGPARGREHPEYGIETVWDTLPEDWLDDRAMLARRISTDAPMGDLELEEENWDADRVREQWARARAQGRRAVESVARHLESGRLVGYTDLLISASTPHLGYQDDTLVLREHRGHGLGLALKQANLAAVQREQSQVRTVRTRNARSNEPMLRINREMGFVVTGYCHEWQKRLG